MFRNSGSQPKSALVDSSNRLVISNSEGGGAQRANLTYSHVVGSPFTLTSAWVKVATTTADTKSLILSSVVGAGSYDIEWVSVPAGASAPTDTYGEGIQAGEDFATRAIPIGDIYLKSAAGNIAIVKTGA